MNIKKNYARIMGHRAKCGLLLLLVAANASSTLVAAAEPSGDQWTHLENVTGSGGCAARLAGDEIDTMLILNRNDQLILVAGRADWHGSESKEIRLRIDSFELEHLQVSAFNDLLLLPISDDAIIKRLKVAKDLYWTLPSGKYHAEITGLGDALEWVHRCEQRKYLGTGG